jgi:hypothetical protein
MISQELPGKVCRKPGFDFARPDGNRSRWPRTLFASLGWALALAIPQAAGAQEMPLGFSWGPGESIEHDSNFLRQSGQIPGAPVVTDTVYSTSLTGNFHEIYSRQQVTASATVGRVLFQNSRQYDYTQQAFQGNLQSDLPLNGSGTLNFTRSAQLVHFADIGNVSRDVITTNDLNGALDLPVAVDWRGVVGGEINQSKNSAVIMRPTDYHAGEVNGGIRFQPVTGNHVDLLLRSVHGVYPNGGPQSIVNADFRERGADLRVDWTFTGASHLQGRAGFVQRRYDNVLYLLTGPGKITALDRDFSGPAYNLTYLWQVTGASRLTAFADRSTGAAGDNSYLSAVTTTYRLTPSYQASAKIEIDAYVEWSRRNYFSNVYQIVFGLPPGTTRLDNAHNAGASLHWNPRRWFQATFDVHREHRDSTIGVWSYADNVADLSFQALF